jgi:hypothetical protein
MGQQIGGAGSQVLTLPFISVGRDGSRRGNDSQTTTLTEPSADPDLADRQRADPHDVSQGGVRVDGFTADVQPR